MQAAILNSPGNMEDSGGSVSRVYANAKILELDADGEDWPENGQPLQHNMPKCEHNSQMFGPDVESVKRTIDFPLSPEETGDSFVQPPSHGFGPIS